MKRLVAAAIMAIPAVAFARTDKWTVLPTAQNPRACSDAIMPNPRVNIWVSARLICTEQRGDRTVEIFHSSQLTLHVQETDSMVVQIDPWGGVGSISNGRARMTFVLPKEVVPAEPQKETFSGNRVSEWSGSNYTVYRIGNSAFSFVIENKNKSDGPVEAALRSPPIEKPKQAQPTKADPPNKAMDGDKK